MMAGRSSFAKKLWYCASVSLSFLRLNIGHTHHLFPLFLEKLILRVYVKPNARMRIQVADVVSAKPGAAIYAATIVMLKPSTMPDLETPLMPAISSYMQLTADGMTDEEAFLKVGG